MRLPSCAAAAVIACCGPDAAVAAKVYRCGNAYQDLPCEAARPAEIRPADKAATPSPAASKTAAGPAATDRVVLSTSTTIGAGATRTDARR